ncbi:DUF1211 domain-containing protein [Flagellimonas sp. 389]|uniref:TMEM175 family protein n=1 Tax=Flagellimonas sp. 389 TaxID=2835862 RepID=UPI001BD2AAE3|nr:TMEM175 family protein [Flagellimonas sp. 389]MBS9461150.1 DUF1211 domain-containing protein [Flagellimonas sp. 389]
MLKELLRKDRETSKEGFRYRGLESSRLENLTDAIFGFAITLLVISSEVPTNYLELQASMYSFIGFIFCTMLLLSIWNKQSEFFLHYGLQDRKTKVLNFLFLFVLLFYVYPLKYLFSYLGTVIYVRIKLAFGDDSDALNLVIDDLSKSDLTTVQWGDLMIRFGLGLFFIYFIFMIKHINALKKKVELQLNGNEIFITKTFIQSYAILIGIPLLSMLVVLLFGGKSAPISGFIYLLIPIALSIHKKYRNKRKALIV